MTYSCTDFTDSILDALEIVVPEHSQDRPEDQAELAMVEIKRMKDLIADQKAAIKIWSRALADSMNHGTKLQLENDRLREAFSGQGRELPK